MIKKYLFIVLALLLMFGVANAANIPMVLDPQNAPEVWTTEVYNNSGATLTSGMVVVWDSATDTTDASYAYRTSWVTTTSTADLINVAGVVVDGTIVAGDVGTIAIYGPVYTLCADNADGVTQYYTVGTANGVTGQCGDYSAGNNTGVLGWAIASGPVDTAYGGGGGVAGQNLLFIPIFVNPYPSD